MSEILSEVPMVLRRTPSLRWPLLATGFQVLSVGLIAGCMQSPPATEQAPERATASGIATPPLKIGDPLPPLSAAGWLNGEPPAPNAPGVRLLVVDAWGSWCPHCA